MHLNSVSALNALQIFALLSLFGLHTCRMRGSVNPVPKICYALYGLNIPIYEIVSPRVVGIIRRRRPARFKPNSVRGWVYIDCKVRPLVERDIVRSWRDCISECIVCIHREVEVHTIVTRVDQVYPHDVGIPRDGVAVL